MRRLLTLLFAVVCTLTATAQNLRAAELVMFDDPACVWCKRWLAEVGPGYPNSEEGRRAPLRRIYIREQAASGIRLKTPVTATPTFVLADDGQEVGRITGYPGIDYFYPMLGEQMQKLPPVAPRSGTPGLRDTSVRSD